ncbi:hypothetical protein VNO77_01390 [Canavalia gladiata]|uniref:Uncharacterized protein n=1 Tax=Canavalia gladiata TaxID=3824 RepID=A0AAN9MR51_CANGL
MELYKMTRTMSAVELVLNGATLLHKYTLIVKAVRGLLARNWNAKLEHTFHEAKLSYGLDCKVYFSMNNDSFLRDGPYAL